MKTSRALGSLVCACTLGVASAQVPYVRTPEPVVMAMLKVANVGENDVVYDLGSGDGRVVIAAAKVHGCKAVGVELDKELVAKSRAKAKAAGVDRLVTIEHADLFEADFSTATVVTLFVTRTMARKLIPKLDGLKAGSRVVCHFFPIPGVTPDRVVKVTSEEDDVERPIYLYTVPLRKEKK
jgi:protein-L-isoaspartate O-methyltransferase